MTAVFDHHAVGTPEQSWTPVLAGLAELQVPELPLLVLAAHPDDETLGAGGLIHLAAAAGRPVEVVIASDGEASHPDSPTHSAADLARIRRREVAAAVAALAPRARLGFLGLPDSRLAEHVETVAAALTARLRRPALVVTPWAGDGHPDHEACADAGARAVAAVPGCTRWQYPIWAWHWAAPDDSVLRAERLGRLPLTAADRAAKRTAIGRHVSQHRPLSELPGDEAILPPGVLAHFERDTETFVLPAPAGRPAYFDALYAGKDDPWGLGDRFYEVRKRELLLAALPRPRFASAFEPGCATGLLTARLAERCDAVLACDVAGRAVELARARLRDAPHVRIEQRCVPRDWPAGTFDLVVLSEVGYYCADLSELAARVDATLAGDGVLVACHWRHPAPDHPHPAEEVHAAVGARLHRIAQHAEEDFLLDVWTRDGASVARSTGVIT